MTVFQPIPVQGLTTDEQMRALRLNSLGSLYVFIKIALRRKKLIETLHLPMCQYLERDHIKDIYEMPRDHFKSTICSEGLPMWRALPISQQDLDDLAKIGYGDEFLRYMLRKHNPNIRNLLVSENITNSAKLGKRIRWHFESNALYRALFAETLPDTQCIWTNFSLHVKRPSDATSTGGAHGEGTFDFLGVGGALQSRHYNGLIVQDDLVGRKAIESQTIMDGTIDYHRLLIGAYEDEDEGHEGDELVVGNRWGFHDLNSYVREHEPWFRLTMHSALGGCCSIHPPNLPILPNVFTFEKLMQMKERLGSYHFSCQFLNNPAAPENADFREGWLSYFTVGEDNNGRFVVHEVRDGIVRKDLRLPMLSLAMVTDPNHSGNQGMGRCRHAILVVGQSSEGNFYLLDAWAQAASYDTYFDKLYEIAKKWRIRKLGFETIAAQKFAAYHIGFRNRTEQWPLKIQELKGEVEAPDGTLSRKKEWRIRNIIAPIAERGRLWVQKQHQDFIQEFITFPRGKFVDQLDAFAYVPQCLKTPHSDAHSQELLQANLAMSRLVNQPYSGMAN